MINKKYLISSLVTLFAVFSFLFFIKPVEVVAVACAGADQCLNSGYFSEGCVPLNSTPCGNGYTYCSDNPGGGNTCGSSTCWQGTICDGVSYDPGEICQEVNSPGYGGPLPCPPPDPGQPYVCQNPLATNFGLVGQCIPPVGPPAPGAPGCACISGGVCILDASRCTITESCGDGRNGAGEACDLGSGNNGGCPNVCNANCTAVNSCGSCLITEEGNNAQFFSADPYYMTHYAQFLDNNTCYATGVGDLVNSLCFLVNPTSNVQGKWRVRVGGDGFSANSEFLDYLQWACDNNNTAGIGPGGLYYQKDIHGDTATGNPPTYEPVNCIRKYSCLINNNPSVNGVCGTASRTYAEGSVSYGNNTFCSSGNLTAVAPPFPSAGNTSTWYCAGTGSGGSPSPQCVAVNPSTTIIGPISEVSLVVVKSPTIGGSVESNDGKISCGNDCSEVYDSGTVISLTATPASSYWRFSGWAGSCSGVGQCILTISGAQKTVTANFAPRLFDYKEF